MNHGWKKLVIHSLGESILWWRFVSFLRVNFSVSPTSFPNFGSWSVLSFHCFTSAQTFYSILFFRLKKVSFGQDFCRLEVFKFAFTPVLFLLILAVIYIALNVLYNCFKNFNNIIIFFVERYGFLHLLWSYPKY